MGLLAWMAGVAAMAWLLRRWTGRQATPAEAARERGWGQAIHAAGSSYLGSMAGVGPVQLEEPEPFSFEADGDHVLKLAAEDVAPDPAGTVLPPGAPRSP